MVFLILPLSVPVTAALAALIMPPCLWRKLRASKIGDRDRFLEQSVTYNKELQDYEKRVQRNQAHRQIWEASWLCTSCGKGWYSSHLNILI